MALKGRLIKLLWGLSSISKLFSNVVPRNWTKNSKKFLWKTIVATLALVLWPKQGVVKVQAKSELEITFHAPKSARECEGMNPKLPNELPLWELKSQWTFKFSKGNYICQNSLDWGVPYIIGIFWNIDV
jgi:hypothetical protein